MCGTYKPKKTQGVTNCLARVENEMRLFKTKVVIIVA